MRRLVGYTLFWVGLGMMVKMLFDSVLVSVLLILFLLLMGYNLFMGWEHLSFLSDAVLNCNKKTAGWLWISRSVLLSAVYAHHLLRSLYFTGSQTSSAHIHFLCRSCAGFHFDLLNVWFPDLITPSVWMAHLITEMYGFITNSTSCHDCTSLPQTKSYQARKNFLLFGTHNKSHSNRYRGDLQA